MSNVFEQAIEAVYDSLENDNHEIDDRISALKEAMAETDKDHVIFNKDRLAQNNREGRKRMESYFKKRGVKIKFD